MTGVPAGGAHLLVFTPESAPDDLWIAVAFESREAYQANSDSPEMQERYNQMQEYMAEPPEWHDGEVVAPWA
jgi:quinol monooxygenase YgiN